MVLQAGGAPEFSPAIGGEQQILDQPDDSKPENERCGDG